MTSISSQALWLSLLIIGLLTLAIRLSFILFFGKKEIPPLLLKAFRFVPVAVLSALILPDLFLTKGHVNLSLSNPRLIAGIVAVVVAWCTKNVLLTIIAGMGVLFVMHLILR